jgi:hypothetical protein
MKPEFKTGMPFADYRAIDACHKSALKHVKTGKHLKKYEAKDDTDTDALRFGRLFHTALLDPQGLGELECYETQEWIAKKDHPDGLSINDQKALWKKEREDNGIEYFLKADEAEAIVKMADAVRSNPLAAKYLDADPAAEAALFWTDPRTGLPCKSLLDLCLVSRDIIIEVKTDVDPSPQAFGKKIYNMGYHVGAWFNREGWRAVHGRDLKAFVYIVVEKSDPHSVGVYVMNAHDFEAGEIDGVPAMIRYKLIKAGGLQDHNQGEDGQFRELPVQTPQWVHFKLDGDGEIDAPEPEGEEGGAL